MKELSENYSTELKPQTLFFKMDTKEKVKNQLDTLSDAEVRKVYQYIEDLKGKPAVKKSLPFLDLKGKLDGKNIRSIAYD